MKVANITITMRLMREIFTEIKEIVLFFLLDGFTGAVHYFDALFWHPHASSQHYVPVSSKRAI